MSDKEQRIRTRAYQIWEREGRAEGRAEDHWRQAEIEIERERTQPSAHAIGSQEKPRKNADPRKKALAAKTAGAGASGAKKALSKPNATPPPRTPPPQRENPPTCALISRWITPATQHEPR